MDALTKQHVELIVAAFDNQLAGNDPIHQKCYELEFFCEAPNGLCGIQHVYRNRDEISAEAYALTLVKTLELLRVEMRASIITNVPPNTNNGGGIATLTINYQSWMPKFKIKSFDLISLYAKVAP